jgi:PBP1b-binding outer membrane lipoprotein LpoB
MKITVSIKLSMYSVLALIAICFCGCASDNIDGVEKANSQLKGFREEIQREDINTSKEMEADLDDDLNPAERRAVHPIFEKNLKAKQRMQNVVFGDIPEGK